MRRKTAIGVMAITAVAMPAALFALATVVMGQTRRLKSCCSKQLMVK